MSTLDPKHVEALLRAARALNAGASPVNSAKRTRYYVIDVTDLDALRRALAPLRSVDLDACDAPTTARDPSVPPPPPLDPKHAPEDCPSRALGGCVFCKDSDI